MKQPAQRTNSRRSLEIRKKSIEIETLELQRSNTMAIFNKRIEYTKEKLIDHYLRRDSVSDFVYGIVRFLGIIIQNIYCVSSYLVLSWIILLPISWVKSDVYSKAENYLYNSLLFIVSSWSLAAEVSVVESGDEYKYLIEEPYIQMNGINKHAKAAKEKHRDLQSLKNEQFTKIGESELNHRKHFAANSGKGDKTSRLFHDTRDSGDSIDISDEANNDLKVTNNYDGTSSCPSMTNSNDNVSKIESKQDMNSAICDNVVLKPNSTFKMQRNHQKQPRILLLCNHISTADVPLMMQAFSTLTNQSVLWVLDSQFKPTNFGLVCMSHGDFFISKDSFTDGSLRDQVLKYPDRNLLVLFPEGGFWRKRLDGSNRYAIRNGLPMTRYVTHPRFGAFKDLIDPSVNVTHIIDATLLYDDIKNPLSILDIALGNRKEPAILNYKVYERNQINPTEEWLRNIWLEKDRLLQQYYEDRSSFYKRFEGTLRTARLDWFKVLAVHLFYLLVCYLTIYRLFSATSVTMLKARDLYYSNI